MKAAFSIFLALLISISISANPQDKWTPDDIIFTESVSSPVFSPDGTKVIWSKKTGLKKEDKFVNKLYLTHLDKMKDGKPLTIQLTQGKDSERNAIFSKDGENIYFLSSRDKGKKLWKLSIFGGEPQEIFEFKNGISSIQWIDNNNLAYLSNDGKSLYELNNEKRKDNTKIIEDEEHWKPTRVYAFNFKTKKIKRLTSKQQMVTNYTVSKDGNYMITSRMMGLSYPSDGQKKPEITLYNFKNGSSKVILKDKHLPAGFTFSPDNSGFYYQVTLTSNKKYTQAGQNELYFFNLKDNKSHHINLDWNNGLGRGYFLSGDYIFTTLANGPLKKIGLYKKSGDQWTTQNIDFPEMNEHIAIMGVSKETNKILFNHSTASQMPEYYVADLKISHKSNINIENKTTLIDLNAKLKKKKIAKSEIIYWKGAKGEEINGILYYPKNYEAGKKYPLILSIHGGPTGYDQDSWSERWSTYPQIMTQKGAFILKPNYHGSGNHGQAFAESIAAGDYYALDEIDLYEGIQFLNKKGFINMDMLGLMGWSNGAILTTWMSLKYPDMFKVAAPGAGDVNWTSDYGTCSFGVKFDQYYFGGAPWDDVDGKNYNPWYIDNSPIFEIEKIKTPTIIFHGSEDRSVPRDQGWEYFRGLQQVGQTPVKFLWFPGQPHGLQKISHQMRKMTEEIKWFDKYLFNTLEEENEAFKENSPLSSAMKIAKASKVDGKFGVLKNAETLIPEMISLKKENISLSQFELTNAQFAEFDKDFTYQPVEANYPVIGLSKQQIKAYINWLNNLTGDNYRLPNKTEAQKWHKLANENANKENTLNYWAGYEITSDDANDLAKKLKAENLSLLKRVGNFAPLKIGTAYVFDLSGNTAEYFMDGDELKVYGYDAHTFADPYDLKNNQSKMIGLRLVKE